MATAAKAKTKKPTAKKQEQEPVEAVEVDAADNATIRAEAERIRKQENYAGKMTFALLRALEPLLYLPLPAKYIEHRAAGEGVAFEMTGVKSIQVQIDRMNAVLGQEHWRSFTTFREGGSLCRAVVIVGNDLQYARMEGEELLTLVVGNGDIIKEADVLVERHGWGGWKRGSQPGDIYKASETNALKRVLARFGPASEVYNQDFEDDPAVDAPEMIVQAGAATQAPAPAPAQPELTPEQAEANIQMMLQEQNQPSGLITARAAANEAMMGLPEPPSVLVRFQLLAARAYDERQLKALVERCGTTSDEAAQAPAEEADPIPPADAPSGGVPLPAEEG